DGTGPLSSNPPFLLQVAEDLAHRALARLDRTVQVALEVDRRVLAGEVARSLASAFHPGELGVLPDLPVGVRALRPRVRGPEVEERPAVVPLRHARQHGLDLPEELLRARLQRAAPEARADLAAGVVDEDPRRARLRTRDLPCVLVATVGVRLTVEPLRPPDARRELQVQL